MFTEDAFIDFKCPYCGATLSFPADDAGHIVTCTECTEPVIVPEKGAAVGGKIPVPMQTSRLALRRFKPTDWKDLLDVMSNADLFRYVEGGPMTEEQVLQWIESDSHVKLTTPGQPFNLGIELLETEKLVGCLSLAFSPPIWLHGGFAIQPKHLGFEPVGFFDPFGAQAQLNVFVHPAYQRKGIATEAADAALELCFGALCVHRVIATCSAENIAAIKLCEKLHMRCEGKHLKAAAVHAEWHDMVSFALLDEEFFAQSHPQTQ